MAPPGTHSIAAAASSTRCVVPTLTPGLLRAPGRQGTAPLRPSHYFDRTGRGARSGRPQPAPRRPRPGLLRAEVIIVCLVGGLGPRSARLAAERKAGSAGV